MPCPPISDSLMNAGDADRCEIRVRCAPDVVKKPAPDPQVPPPRAHDELRTALFYEWMPRSTPTRRAVDRVSAHPERRKAHPSAVLRDQGPARELLPRAGA